MSPEDRGAKENARRKAVALRYDAASDAAPKVVAKGAGHLAGRIIEIAREHGVHVHEDPMLAGLLAAVEVDQEIPAPLYRAVAEVLAFVYRVDRGIGADGVIQPRRKD